MSMDDHDCCGNFVGGHPFDKPKKCPLYIAKMNLAHEEALHLDVLREDAVVMAQGTAIIKRLREQRDGANNRIKYLENLITECHGRAGSLPAYSEAVSSLWTCGCGHVNGANLATCAACTRPPNGWPEERR